ncbi:hypothetical protein CRV24_003536 [Beauveria bassiana]|nr:hypothetical protein CRV24_003536 [Beauveria bassiana]KAH8718955.1 hypothetical protein HC256_003579 [Beauveria bassiana]
MAASWEYIGICSKHIASAKDANLSPIDFLHRHVALQIQDLPQPQLGLAAHVLVPARPAIKVRIMVTRDHNFDRVRKTREPVELLLDVGRGARVGEVARVDQDVPVGHVDGQVVRVRDAHDAHGRLAARLAQGSPSQPDEDVVEVDREKGERREEQVVEHGEALPLRGAPQTEGLQQTHLLGRGLVPWPVETGRT